MDVCQGLAAMEEVVVVLEEEEAETMDLRAMVDMGAMEVGAMEVGAMEVVDKTGIKVWCVDTLAPLVDRVAF